MSWPSVVVKIAFTGNAFDASPTLTDISSDVLSIAIRRGRTYEMNRIEAGTATVTLKNLSGAYWPYQTNIKPVKRIYIGATWDGTTYDLFTGYIEKWQPKWLLAGVKVPTMELTCSDLQKNLSRFLLNNAGYPSQLSGARITAVLGSLLWLGGTTIATGQSTMQATGALVNLNAMSHIYSVLDSELGIFYMSRDNKATFEDKLTRSTKTSSATFTDVGGASYILPTISYDDLYIYNDIRRTRTGGTEQVAQDSTSITQYGQRSLQSSGLLNSTDDDIQDSAYFYLSKFKNPLLRTESLVVMPSVNPSTLYPYVLGFDISIRIKVVLTEASIQDEYYIEGIDHTWNAMEPENWRTVWQLSNATNQKYPVRDTLTLHPNAAGDLTEWTRQYPDEGEHWDKMVTSGDTKFIFIMYAAPGPFRDLYHLDNGPGGSNPVVKIDISSMWGHYASGSGGTCANIIKIGGAIYTGATHNADPVASPKTDTFNISNLTLADIDALQAGVKLITQDNGDGLKADEVHVVVSYYTDW